MKEHRPNFKGFRATDGEAKLIAAIQEKIGAKTESEAILKSITSYARQLKVKA